MASRSNSWGHALQRLTPEQLADLCRWDGTCRAGRGCEEPTTHLGAYNYVTGRAGRISWARRYMCDSHAEKFRAKHELPEPETAPTPRHALERIIDGEEG
jgi:hypothetical protein